MLNQFLLRTVEGLLFFILSFSAGWILHGWKDGNKAYQGVIQSVHAQQELNQKSSVQYEAISTEQQKKSEFFNEKSKVEIVEKPVYNQCIIPDSGMQLLNAAIDSANKIGPTS